MGVLTPTHPEDLDVPDATFASPDVTTFCRVDELGLVVVGQRLEPQRAVLARMDRAGGGRAVFALLGSVVAFNLLLWLSRLTLGARLIATRGPTLGWLLTLLAGAILAAVTVGGRPVPAVTLVERRDSGMIHRIQRFTTQRIPSATIAGLEPQRAEPKPLPPKGGFGKPGLKPGQKPGKPFGHRGFGNKPGFGQGQGKPFGGKPFAKKAGPQAG